MELRSAFSSCRAPPCFIRPGSLPFLGHPVSDSEEVALSVASWKKTGGFVVPCKAFSCPEQTLHCSPWTVFSVHAPFLQHLAVCGNCRLGVCDSNFERHRSVVPSPEPVDFSTRWPSCMSVCTGIAVFRTTLQQHAARSVQARDARRADLYIFNALITCGPTFA